MESNSTVDELLSRWLTVHTLNRRPSAQKFNQEIAATIRKHWPDVSRLADSVTTADLLEFSTLVAHYCPSRWNAIVAALRYVSALAKAIPRRKLRMKDFTPPTQQQFAALLSESDQSARSHAGLVIRFLAFTGLRISEARALRWENVFDDRLEVPGHVTGNKSGKRRCVPLLSGCRETLERLKPLGDGIHVLPRASARNGIRGACRRAGLAAFTHHDFRHLFATRCIESGVDLPTVSRWLGHQDGGALLAKTYFHLLDDHSRRMAAKVRIAA